MIIVVPVMNSHDAYKKVDPPIIIMIILITLLIINSHDAYNE